MDKILIVDDEQDILDMLSYNLNQAGYETSTAQDGLEGLKKAKEEHPDLIILDVMMPNMDGIEVCQVLREMPEFKKTLIAFLSARGEDYSQIAGFKSGADEYITKPIRPKVLIARIEALLKRKPSYSDQEDVNQVGCLKIDFDKMLVYKNDRTIELPKMEFNLLKLLTSRPGKVFRREQIYQNLWGDHTLVGDRTIDVHIRKLREKIGDDCIKTLKGVGYKYNEACV